jgi:ComF family protein
VTLAPQCAACARVLDEPLAGPVCATCWDNVRQLSPLYLVARDELDGGRAVGDYDGTLRDIIHALKYDGRRTIARHLAGLMRAAGADVLREAERIVPVPLHPWKRARRGFNQAAELAQHLGQPVAHALWRRRATSPQTGLTAAQRKRNVRRAFSATPFMSRRALDDVLADRVIVLVDDVFTTGATMNECARVLKAHGAREVYSLTVARASPPGSHNRAATTL